MQCPVGEEYSGLSLPGKLSKDQEKLGENAGLCLQALWRLEACEWQLGGLASEAHLNHLLGEAVIRGQWVGRGPT